jgi:hypothetical protein
MSIYIRDALSPSKESIVVPYAGNIAMWDYLRNFIFPACNLPETVFDGRTVHCEFYVHSGACFDYATRLSKVSARIFPGETLWKNLIPVDSVSLFLRKVFLVVIT